MTTVPAPVPPSSGPAGAPSPSATTAPALVHPIVPVTEEPAPDLTTYAGTTVDASFEFDHPSAWTVTDTSASNGIFDVKRADGEPIATLQLLIAWGAVCDASTIR
ncbi:hypothetical protein IWX75_002037 [Arthrobacter sp. CAN_A6]|uniref:hypothetical protein n=1 Tax=Arthrobacter sp. CAN_A6 TaxID=2787721 RepID=UPI0018CBE217